MIRALKNLVPAAAAALALAPLVSADIERLVPAGTAVALAKIENLSALRGKAQSDPLIAEFGEKFFAPIFSEFEDEASAALAEEKSETIPAARAEVSKVRREICSALRAIAAQFDGEALVAISDLKNVLVIADCRADFDLEKSEALFAALDRAIAENLANPPAKIAPERDAVPALMPAIPPEKSPEKAPQKSPFRDESLAGVPVKILPGGRDNPDCIWTIFDGKFFLSCNRAELTAVLALAKNPAGTPAAALSDSAAFKKARERIGDADFWLYLDGATLAEKLYAFAEELDAGAEQRFRENPASFMILATPFVKNFAPEAIESVWSAWTLDAAKNYPTESALVWKEKKGIVAALVTDAVAPTFEKPQFLPAHADAWSVSAGSWSLGRATEKFTDLLRASSPVFGLLDLQLLNLKMSNALDIPAAVGTLGNGFAEYAWGTPRKSVAVLNTADPALLADALEKTAALIDREKTQKITLGNGAEICVGGNDDLRVAYTFVGSNICIGAEANVREFAEFAGGNEPPKTSIWSDAEFAAAEALLPAGGCGISLSRLSFAVKNLGAEFAKKMEEKGFPNFCAPLEKLGPDDFNYTQVEKMYLRENELTVLGRTLKNADRGGNAQ